MGFLLSLTDLSVAFADLLVSHCVIESLPFPSSHDLCGTASPSLTSTIVYSACDFLSLIHLSLLNAAPYAQLGCSNLPLGAQQPIKASESTTAPSICAQELFFFSF